MSGNIRKRGNNWLITVYTGKKADGKPIRHYETIRGSKSDAQRRVREILSTVDNGTYAAPTKHTVADLMQEWHNGYVKTNCSMRTYDGYGTIIRNHINPAIGHIMLKDLQPATIETFYGEDSQKFSGQTILHVHRVLSQALKWAVRHNYLGRNPAEFVRVRVPRQKVMRTLNPDEVEKLLSTAQGNFYYPIIYTAISTGLRRNELLGLRWRDIDDLSMTISVNQVLFKRQGKVEIKEPKTNYSRRRVSMTPKLACFLREYREQQQLLYLELDSILGPDDLIFPNQTGIPMDPSVLSHNFGRICKKAGLNVRFHDLRHTCASLMLLAGVHPKIVSEMLGHSTVAITLDIYSHVTPGLQEAAARRLDSVLPAAVSRAAN